MLISEVTEIKTLGVGYSASEYVTSHLLVTWMHVCHVFIYVLCRCRSYMMSGVLNRQVLYATSVY